MENLKKTFCRFDMVCDDPVGVGLEVIRMPQFFSRAQDMETDRFHMHGFYEIVWFKDGGGVHHIDFNDYPVEPGRIFFVSVGQVHSFDACREREGVVIKICPELIGGDSGSSDGGYLRFNVFDATDSLPYCDVPKEGFPLLDSLAAAIEEELKQDTAIGHKEYLQSLLRMFLITVQRQSGGRQHSVMNPARNSHRSFLAFRKLLEENYPRLHTVKDYASMLSITPKTLTQYVNECSPMTPLEMINSRIVLEAKRLLRYSVLSVKEIAFRLGFDDPSYFVKFFKRIVRQSPADYRESF